MVEQVHLKNSLVNGHRAEVELLLANDLVLLLLCLGCKTLERACTQALFNLGLLLSDLADNAVNGYVEGVVLVLREIGRASCRERV